MQSSIRINSPAAVKIVYTIIYTFYACIGLFVALYLARVPEFRRFKALIYLYWILITCTIVEGIYFGIMLSKLKSKLVSYCDDRTAPANRGSLPGTGADSGKVIMPIAASPITCHRNQALFVSVFYVLGPGGWLILHISWILVVVLYSKALRRRYPSAGDEDTTKVLPYHNSHSSQYQDPASKQGVVRPSSPMSGAWNTIHRTFSSQSQLNSGKDNRATEMGVISGVHPYQTHPFQEATYQQGKDMATLQRPLASARTSSVLRNPFKRGSSDASAQGQTNDLHHIDSDNESENSDDEEDEEVLARGRQQNRKDGSTSTVATGVASEIPADGKGWWLRQMEGKKRGEFCPCMNTSELRVPDNETCWCGKERRESHARLSVASGSASGSGSGSRPSPSFSAARTLTPVGASSSRPSSSNVTLPQEPSPVHHRTEPRQD
ncbi:hypothetical protein BGZ93_004755 [Podila epicladia]|nr:hypothetical protein BGZ93_004755 [Podila epicladia]